MPGNDANCSVEMIPPVGWAPDHETVITWLLRRLEVLETVTENDRRSTRPLSKNVLQSVSLAVNDAPWVKMIGRAPQPCVLSAEAPAGTAVSASMSNAATEIPNRVRTTRRRSIVVFIFLTPNARAAAERGAAARGSTAPRRAARQR